MSLLQFANLSEAILRELVAQRCPESQTLDFKRALPGTSDREKSEFLKDVCAFANRDGGDLVYGISEEGGAAKDLIPIVGEAPDVAKRRLGQILDAGLEPRVIGIQIKDITVADGSVLVIRVPASFNGPHRYTVNNVSRFAMRNGTFTTEMTYDQLRAGFDRTATLAERASRFRQDRVLALSQGQTWQKFAIGPLCVVHLVPIGAMAGGEKVDIQSLYNNYTPFIFEGWRGASRSTNLDGLIVYAPWGGDGLLTAYTQVFRSGALEAAFSCGRQHDGRNLIPSGLVARYFREAMLKFMQHSRALQIGGPAIAGVAVLSVADYEFALGQQFFRADAAKADRNHLILPDAWISSIEAATNVDEVARPLLDTLWQAFGVECCPYYDAQGNWKSS